MERFDKQVPKQTCDQPYQTDTDDDQEIGSDVNRIHILFV